MQTRDLLDRVEDGHLNPPPLAVVNVSYSYGQTRGLNQISTRFEPGVVGLLGPNGAGKSTLLRILSGGEPPDSGQVLWRGAPISQEHVRKQYAHNLGYLPQDFGFVPGLTVQETVQYVATMRGVTNAVQASQQALQAVGLEQFARRRLGALSGGQRRRVGIAQAIVAQPRILLLDEPTAGLDPAQRARFRRLLQAFSADTLVLVSTHLVEDVAAICTAVKILDEGELRFEGSPAELAALAADEAEGTSPLERGYHTVLGGARW